MALVAVIAVIGTLAYLGANSEKKENTFIGSEGISLNLEEKEWEKKTDGVSEEDRAQNYTPGVTYQKDPVLKNTTTDAATEEWVAIKVSFELGTKSEEADETTGKYTVVKNDNLSKWKYFDEIITIASTGNTTGIKGFNTGTGVNNWTLIATSTSNSPTDLADNDSWAIFVYNSKLAGNNAKTATLFDTVTMKSQEVFAAKPSDLSLNNGHTWIYKDDDDKIKYELPAFNISVIGAAIKVETENDVGTGTGNDWQKSKKQSQVKTELLALLANNS